MRFASAQSGPMAPSFGRVASAQSGLMAPSFGRAASCPRAQASTASGPSAPSPTSPACGAAAAGAAAVGEAGRPAGQKRRSRGSRELAQSLRPKRRLHEVRKTSRRGRPESRSKICTLESWHSDSSSKTRSRSNCRLRRFVRGAQSCAHTTEHQPSLSTSLPKRGETTQPGGSKPTYRTASPQVPRRSNAKRTAMPAPKECPVQTTS
mmetsp:Transcript_150474/g.483685  ORF Transcript_150474/g.483685 Transcript_150474/m.483685 type:complete len:207 (+) Transcript_150474:313-933(+)